MGFKNHDQCEMDMKKFVRPAQLSALFSIIIFVVFVVMNLLAVAASMKFYPLVYSADEIDAVRYAMNRQINFYIFPSFIIPLFISLWYVSPIYGVFFRWSEATPADLAKRRLLNAPLILSLISFFGWSLSIAGVVYSVLSSGMNVSHTLVSKVLIFGVSLQNMSFVLTYYFMDYMSRRFLIPIFFLDGKLSKTDGTIVIPLRVRFMIFFYSVGVFPAILYYGLIMAANERAGAGDVGNLPLLLVILMQVMGIFLTYIVSSSYSRPVSKMRDAARKVHSGNYNIFVPVYSNDEVGNLGETMNEMARGLLEKELITQTFGRMVDPKVRDHLLSGNLDLGGEMLEATVLFADIKGFTTLTEVTSAENVVNMLNRFFDRMAQCVMSEDGIVNGYIGDAVMAVFGVPVPVENPAESALRAAERMRDEVASLCKEFCAEGLPELKVKIGISTGGVLAGNVGSRNRMEYTVIGDAVNLASRLEGAGGELGLEIAVDGETRKMLADPERLKFVNRIGVRGRRAEVDIYTLND